VIDPGRLRERVFIQHATEVRNSLGESTQSWSTCAERWASVEGLSGREVLLSGQQQTEVTHRVRLRYVAGLSTRMRLSWRGRILEIASVLEHAHRTEHELLCTEDVGP
jgi:SPP1 family predicted phage head-tail adaptor